MTCAASARPARLTLVTEIDASARVELLDLDAMPSDRAAATAAKREMSAREYGVWTILREHLWEYGTLPTGFKALAKIAGIGAASMERMGPKLACHFDRTPQGAWTDDFLVSRRGTSLVVPSPEARPVDPKLSATRREIGAKGGVASAAARAAKAESRASGSAPVLLRYEAKFQANGASKSDAMMPSFASGFAGVASGWLVGSSHNLSSKTNQPTAGASQAKAVQANHDDDAVMIRAMLSACPSGRLDRSTAVWGLEKVKGWFAEGCSFELDYLPALRTWARTSIVKNAANDKIRKATFDMRDERIVRQPQVATRPDLSAYSAETKVLHRSLEAELGTARYVSWCTGLDVVAIADGAARIAVPTKLQKTTFRNELADQLLKAARTIQAGVTRIEIEVRLPPSAIGAADPSSRSTGEGTSA